jgi:hypothetical protein
LLRHAKGRTKIFLFYFLFLMTYVKEDEMGRACSTNGGEEECIQNIGWIARRKETTGKTKTLVGGQY